MKFIFLFLSFLICSSSLLDNVRKEIIDIALVYLPKRENVNFLKMVNEMNKAKIKYSMNKVESTYFIYKWITQNIQYNCNYIIEEDNPTEIILTYNEGKGGTIGITGLFTRLCELLNVESNIITGLTKIATYNHKNKTNLIEIKDYAWNSVFINRQYYLIDPIKGAGSCNRNRFYKSQDDKYFGMNPKDSIRFHFPNEKKWQLLSKPITKDEFSSMALISEGFFNYFETFSPDVQTLKNVKDIKFVMTFDKPIDKIEIFASFDALNYEEYEGEEDYILDEPTIKDGTCSISIWVSRTGYFYFGIRVNDKETFFVTYESYYFPNNS